MFGASWEIHALTPAEASTWGIFESSGWVPHPRVFFVNAAIKGLAGGFGVKAAVKGLTPIISTFERPKV